MGRDKRNEAKTEHWTKMVRNTMETEAWAALSPAAQALYPWIKFEWRGPQANNNGRLRLSVRQAAEKMGVNRDTAARAFHELQAKGFIVQTTPAYLGIGGQAKSPEYEVTEIALPHQPNGRRLYRAWKPGSDFPVVKARANNPNGKNSKKKTHPNSGDGIVLIFGTNAG